MDVPLLSSQALSPIIPVSLLGFFTLPWFVLFPRLALLLLSVSLIVGQVLRLPLPGQGGGLLLSDVAVIVTLVSTLWYWLRSSSRHVPSMATLTASLVTLFCLLAALPLAFNRLHLDHSQLSVAGLYWLRLTGHLYLLPALIYLFQADENLRAHARRHIYLLGLIIICLGYLQLLFYPNIQLTGWDPHIFRLVSTWLDPNFIGAFLSLYIIFVLSRLKSQTRLMYLLLGVASLALVLTQSRSSLLALGLTSLLFLPLVLIKVRWVDWLAILLTLVFICLASTPVIYYLRDRLLGLLTQDATVSLRLSALAVVWPLAEQQGLLGVGYNAYQFLAAQTGLIRDFTLHSRAGSDNSLLTLWVTTGLLGVCLFLSIWSLLVHISLRAWIRSPSTVYLAPPAASMFLLIHSQFVNSFLYPHLLITLILIVALSLPRYAIS